MLAARACGLEAEWVESAELLWSTWDETSDLWTQDLYGTIRQYLGPAHGFAGNVHALRGYADDDTLRRRVTAALEQTALRDGGLVNWPPTPDSPGEKIRVQWCHGAPGLVTTLGDLIPEPLLLGAGELVWRAGPLAKGPGLCHGTAGNGFALLRLHELTGDERWLDRARRFAMHSIGQVDRQRGGHRSRALHVVDRRRRGGALPAGLPRRPRRVPHGRFVLIDREWPLPSPLERLQGVEPGAKRRMRRDHPAHERQP
jgi:hypothetical protein